MRVGGVNRDVDYKILNVHQRQHSRFTKMEDTANKSVHVVKSDLSAHVIGLFRIFRLTHNSEY